MGNQSAGAPVREGTPVFINNEAQAQTGGRPNMLQRFGSNAMDYLSDRDNRMRLAAGFNSMRLTPDPNIGAMARQQQLLSARKQEEQQQAQSYAKYLVERGVLTSEQAAQYSSSPRLLESLVAETIKTEQSGSMTESTRSKHQQALLAGLAPGTREYAEFMSGNSTIGNMNPEQIGLANTFRGEIDKKLENYYIARDGYQNMLEFRKNPGGVSDYALAVGFAKILDPGSVAREGEVSAVANSGSIGQSLKASVLNAITSNGRLPQQVRDDIMRLSENIYANQARKATEVINSYKPIAERAGVDPSFIYAGPEITMPNREETPNTGAPLTGQPPYSGPLPGLYTMEEILAEKKRRGLN